MIITFDDISLSINTKKIFSNINLTVLPGGILYIKGANGSGKSSLLRIICGLQNPTSGQIKINNINQIDSIAKPIATYIGHELGIKLELTVLDNLLFWARLYNSYEALEAAIHFLDLHDIIDEKAYILSSGNKKKIAMTRLLMSSCPLWILDEFDSNLDESNKKLLHNLIVSKASSGGIIFIASHDQVFTKNPQILEMKNYV